MKKVIGILLVLAIILVGYYIFANAEMTMVNENNETIEFDVTYGITSSEADRLVNDWCKEFHEEAALDMIDENGYFTGSGVLDINEFESEHKMHCDSRAMEKVLRDHYELEHFEITKVGFTQIANHEFATIYKMEAKSKTEPIGYCYIDGEHVDYYEGCVYFTVYSEK